MIRGRMLEPAPNGEVTFDWRERMAREQITPPSEPVALTQ